MGRIHQKAVYSVDFDTQELIQRSVRALDAELKMAPLQYVVQRGEQKDSASYEALKSGDAFRLEKTQTSRLKVSVQSSVRYDLMGKLASDTKLTRSTIGTILGAITPSVFAFYRVNPEDFLRVAARLINEQKAAVIVEHLIYNSTEQVYDIDIFAKEKPREDFSKALKVKHHIYDYVFTDSENERPFAGLLDSGTEVEV